MNSERTPIQPTDTLHRQVLKGHIDEGSVTVECFKPRPKDNGQISTDIGSRVTARSSYFFARDTANLQSLGVRTVTVLSCLETGCAVWEDPIVEEPVHKRVGEFYSNPNHAVIDCEALDELQLIIAASKLLAASHCSYDPKSEEPRP